MSVFITATFFVLVAPLLSIADASGNQPAESHVVALMKSWAGVYDTAEEVVLSPHDGSAIVEESTERRVHTIVAPVELPWIGSDVLYLEELLHEEPDEPRRQVLLRLEPDRRARLTIRVRQFTFREPQRWTRLHSDPQRIKALRREDLDAMPGCDLVLVRQGNQFRGGTVGKTCVDSDSRPARYVDYRLLIGDDLYWYRKRVLRMQDNELLEYVVAFNWFELFEARLFTCRVSWSAEGTGSDTKPIASLNLHDQGGHARVTVPDGRTIEIKLHSRDWPFDANRDALILVVQEVGAGVPLASSWAEIDARQIAVELGWLGVSCGAIASESETVRS